MPAAECVDARWRIRRGAQCARQWAWTVGGGGMLGAGDEPGRCYQRAEEEAIEGAATEGWAASSMACLDAQAEKKAAMWVKSSCPRDPRR